MNPIVTRTRSVLAAALTAVTRRRIPAAVIAIVLACGLGGAPASATAVQTVKHVVWVGSPVRGTWDLPASQGGDGPTQHHTMQNAADQGDFAVDLIAHAGDQVKLYAAPVRPDVLVTAIVDQVGAACSGGADGGSFVTVGFYIDGTQKVGSASYGHLQPAVSPGQTLNRWGAVLGTVGGNYPVNPACWSGAHVHFEMFATAPDYACFNKGYALGDQLWPSNFLGSTGGTGYTTARQPCP